MSNFFSLSHFSFRFKASEPEQFFTDVSCSFNENRLNFVRGKNGAGKSTLFRLLRGRVEADEALSGSVTLHGITYDLSNSEERRKLGSFIRLAPQKFDEMLADNFTFKENLDLARLPRHPDLTRFVETAEVPALVERFGIQYNVPVGLLSGGQRQILSILMALQKHATILLLDEPTAALDDKNSTIVMRFLQGLLETNKNLTIIIICHDKELVEQYAKNTYLNIDVHSDNTRTITPRELNKE